MMAPLEVPVAPALVLRWLRSPLCSAGHNDNVENAGCVSAATRPKMWLAYGLA